MDVLVIGGTGEAPGRHRGATGPIASYQRVVDAALRLGFAAVDA
jgi:hypothetical protein